jgi:hypothetical protein
MSLTVVNVLGERVIFIKTAKYCEMDKVTMDNGWKRTTFSKEEKWQSYKKSIMAK